MPKETIPETLLTIEETAGVLKICVRTVRRMIANTKDPLPIVRIGAAVRVRPSDLERYIAAHRHG